MTARVIDVLLVEDNPQEAEIVRLYLAKRYSHQYTVRHVRNIADALDALSMQLPSVILLDLHLPDTTGLHGFERVSALVPDVPVVILTNYNDERMAAGAVRAGAQDYLVKREVNAALLHRAILYAIERQAAEQAVIKVQERYQLATDGANDCIWDWEAATDTAFFSPRWNELIGIPTGTGPNDLQDWFNRVHPNDIDALRKSMLSGARQPRRHFEHEHRLRHENGDYVWVYARGIVLADSRGDVIRMAGSISSITKRKATERQLVHRALHDGLTGLPNRVLFVERLQQALKRYQRDRSLRFAALYFDLDRFKFVNDSLGHSAGDALLESIARRLAAVIRPGDTVARMGGDEFAVLVADMVDQVDAKLVADRIHDVFLTEFQVAGRGMFSSASIGIAIVSEKYASPEEVLRDADLAMYRAKRSDTRKTMIFDSEMHMAAVSRLDLETDLRHALRREEFVVYYQPIVGLSDRRVVGFEALLRWLHPDRGLLEPGSFLSVLQDTGMLTTLSWWVLEQACRQMREWHRVFLNGMPIGLSVNVSASMFREDGAVERVRSVVRANDIPPDRLSLELTEGDFLDHEELAWEALAELREFGVKIHMDDFGTGYSSLSYLQRCAYDTVKIDRSFVQGIGTEEGSMAIIETIVGLGRMLKMNVVAEGVESKHQFDALVSLECPEAQGYWFSRPVPATEVGELVGRSWRTDA